MIIFTQIMQVMYIKYGFLDSSVHGDRIFIRVYIYVTALI